MGDDEHQDEYPPDPTPDERAIKKTADQLGITYEEVVRRINNW